MTEQPDPTQGSPLTPTQATIVDYARRELEAIRATNLAQLDDAELILTVERLRQRLDDTLQVIDETLRTQPS
ncbi:hypothetical protein PV733_37135 [Streptomyces europaeiscabiei]|uniref:hypothetical protein n=1 Tax=Streptomyces europaeiscabiei TaxID=146819 RepID=UPI0029B9E40E|nr:hypothetical protein [Streptomyces europaeiscabiei]MDX3714458.1 hypothetical protein [Streptomyces europaeiscabiei]